MSVIFDFSVSFFMTGKKYLCFLLVFLDGKFGAYMQVHIQNDGPVTVELVSPTGPMDPKQVRY